MLYYVFHCFKYCLEWEYSILLVFFHIIMFFFCNHYVHCSSTNREIFIFIRMLTKLLGCIYFVFYMYIYSYFHILYISYPIINKILFVYLFVCSILVVTCSGGPPLSLCRCLGGNVFLAEQNIGVILEYNCLCIIHSGVISKINQTKSSTECTTMPSSSENSPSNSNLSWR